jgi:hypothetical protein
VPYLKKVAPEFILGEVEKLFVFLKKSERIQTTPSITKKGIQYIFKKFDIPIKPFLINKE